MTASASNPLRQIRQRLSRLKRAKGFVDWRGASTLARDLVVLLADVRSAIQDPTDGVELVAAFFECDRAILERCDDSGGSVGDVFRFDAKELFVDYAKGFADKAFLVDRLIALCEDDAYGVRDGLIAVAHEFLPSDILRDMADRSWALAECHPPYACESRYWIRAVESVARQLKDAPLFEKARLAAWPDLSAAACRDIAQAYLDAGDAAAALDWVERDPAKDAFQPDEHDAILLSIYEELGMREAFEQVAWRVFRRGRSEKTLAVLLFAIGSDQRKRVIADETRAILSSEALSCSDAEFLVEAQQMDAAEDYMLRHASELNGAFYGTLLALAQALEASKRWLAVVVLYRALLETILQRGISKYYHHGVRYLKKLDVLAGKVDDWRDVMPHEAYKESILKTHGRKSSFWSRYDGKQDPRRRSR